jgi:ATP phosphoribosyltransferase regulatory subunit
MTAASPTLPDSRADALVASYERAGYGRLFPAILQPAEPFLDLSGEDLRRRMYLTIDAAGREMCLRPDFTIAVSRDYLASPQAGKPAGFSYLGPVFRQQDKNSAFATSEFVQAGVESFGRRDTAAADAEIFALALEATHHYGIAEPDIRMGDVGLFIALIGALKIGPVWKRRLIKDFNRAGRLTQDLDQLMRETQSRSEYSGVLSALTHSDPAAARALVTDLLSIAGITAVGGRTVGEIADRFLEQATLSAGNGLPQEIRSQIERFLSISGDPDNALAALRALAGDAKLELNAALDLFESRTGFLAARGIDVRRIKFSTSFGTSLDYYTGFEFRLHDPAARSEYALVAGGRYDNLMTRLGSATPIPAVGMGIWIEDLARLGAKA